MSDLFVVCACGHRMRVAASAMGMTSDCALCGRTLTVTRENTEPAPPKSAPPPAKQATAPKAARRIVSMDQLRGYAMFGMLVVNYLGYFKWSPPVLDWLLKHHKEGFSYADTIAPLFVFVVGMGFRISLKRRIARLGPWAARCRAAKRYLVLFLVGVAFYGPAWRIDWWDALTHIGLSGLLALPFIDKKIGVRVAAAMGYLGLFMVIYMATDYGPVFMMRSMNGGPAGPLSWAFVLLFGTIAYDLLELDDSRKVVTWSLVLGIGLIAAAWVAWYLIPTDWAGYGERWGRFWPFSKRWCIAPAMCLSTGVCFLTFLFFYWICDMLHFRFPHLTVLGENPLVFYLIQYSLMEMNHAYVPDAWRSSMLVGLVGFVCMYASCFSAVKKLNKEGIIIKL